jgi:putative toxin-antitoxin system antitoxin component (TIGR02293 family)
MTKAVAAKSLRRMKIELENLAEETFETADEAARWLRRPHPMLDDKTPLDFVKSSHGAGRVRDVLLSIKYGNVL